jgi:hypothetical protein
MELSRRAFITGCLIVGVTASRLDGASPPKPTITVHRDPT